MKGRTEMNEIGNKIKIVWKKPKVYSPKKKKKDKFCDKKHITLGIKKVQKCRQRRD